LFLECNDFARAQAGELKAALGGLEAAAQSGLAQTLPPIARDCFRVRRNFLEKPARD